MVERSQVIPLRSTPQCDTYETACRRLTEVLAQHTLIDSFFNFAANGKPYPFPEPRHLLPNTAARSGELPYQNTALVVCIDGAMPRALNKHFRLRASNRVAWRNIQRLAPDLDLSDYKAAHCRIDSPEATSLLTKLLPLDYALLVEREETDSSFSLTHMHVKVERLTDNAIKEMGKSLGYIERSLFERGEDFVETLEAKYFEYYGFSANASGRKSAAAMAAQLLNDYGQRFSVFVASQEDCRLTVLDQEDAITQYMLIHLTDADAEAFAERARAAGAENLDPYVVEGNLADGLVVLYRLMLGRTPAARPPEEDGANTKDLLAPWLLIEDEAVLPRPDRTAPEIPLAWAQALDE